MILLVVKRLANSYVFSRKKIFIFQDIKPPKKLLMFQEQTFQAQKIKKICSEKISGISRNETFYPQAWKKILSQEGS